MELANDTFNPWSFVANERIETLTAEGSILILSGVPFTDSGGGQRATQLALEFIRQGFKVIFVNIYPSYEEKMKPLHFKEDLGLLELYTLKDFIENRESVLSKVLLTIVEFPHPALVNTLRKLKIHGKKIVFDYIDNWNTSLGGNWYKPEIEKEIIALSDYLIASAPLLVDSLICKSRRNVSFIANAFNQEIFNIENISFKNPYEGKKNIVLYSGALWGSWFNWELIEYLINTCPHLNFVFIGGCDPYKKKKHSSLTSTFLGLLPQSELPSYIYYSSACIIPFYVDDITDYCNPLKIYEYISMGKQVITTDFKGLQTLPNVTRVLNYDEFRAELLKAVQTEKTFTVNDYDNFCWNHSWKARIIKLRKVVGIGI